VIRKEKPPTGEAPQVAAADGRSSNRNEPGEEERASISEVPHKAEIKPTKDIVEVCSDVVLNHDADPNCATFGLRRHDERRQVLERALVGFVERYVLRAGSLERLSGEIYRLWRDHEGQKRLAERRRRFREDFRRSVRAHARKKRQDKDPDTLLHAARMERLKTLGKRKLSLEGAVAGAMAVTYEDLSVAEKRAARRQILVTTITGRKDRQASATVHFLKDVAAVLERETGHPVRFSSYTDIRPLPEGAPGRHYGSEFDIMQAAAEMAGDIFSNEALAAHVRRIRRDTPRSGGVKK
jgi:hypothetical protein